MYNKSLGKRLSSIRGNSTQMEFAERYGVHKNTLARYERGERAPDAEFLAALARSGYDVNWILIGEGSKVAETGTYDSINWAQLEEVFKAIEMLIDYERRPMRPDLKARLATHLYHYYIEHSEADGKLSLSDRKIVMDIIETALSAGVEHGENQEGNGDPG